MRSFSVIRIVRRRWLKFNKSSDIFFALSHMTHKLRKIQLIGKWKSETIEKEN